MTPEPLQDHEQGASPERADDVLRMSIAARLADAGELDVRQVEVSVADGEVTLEGRVHSETDRLEVAAIADIEGVRRLHNKLAVQDRAHWTFL